MKLSRSNWFFVILSLALSVFGFVSFSITLSPLPEPLLRDTGVISSAEAHRSKGRITVIRFVVSPSGREYAYPDILNNADVVWEAIELGSPVAVDYSEPEDPVLWSVAVAGKMLISPQTAYDARRENGYWALVIGVAFFGCFIYMLFVEGRRNAA